MPATIFEENKEKWHEKQRQFIIWGKLCGNTIIFQHVVCIFHSSVYFKIFLNIQTNY